MPRNRPSAPAGYPLLSVPLMHYRPFSSDRARSLWEGWGSKRRGDRRWRGSVCRATGRSVVPCSVRATFRSRGLECKRYIKLLRFFARKRRDWCPRDDVTFPSLALLTECFFSRHSPVSITLDHIHLSLIAKWLAI